MHQVGAGVLGPVFRAYDPDTDRTVALKSFPLDLTPEQASRLGESFARLATLDLGHPCLIVPTAGGAEGSTAYLVEEYFVADSVDTAIRQYGPAPVPDAVRLVGQLAGGLDFAAAAGVHHGALHPRDVLVAPREVRLTGIGVAQALQEVGFRIQPRRPYSAPERSTAGEWGLSADIYSLAAIGYELLTGRRPTASGETLTIDPQAIPASDAAALAEVFARAFSAAPGDRFPSALAFAAALKHALTGQPIDATAEAERPRSRRGRPGGRRAGMLPLDEPEAPVEPEAHAEAPRAAHEVPAATHEAPAATIEAPAADEAPAALTPETIVAAGPPPFAPEAPPAPTVSEPETPAPTPIAETQASEPSAPLLPAEVPEVREALLAAEPELPSPPPALDDLDLRAHGPEPSVERVDEPVDFHVAAPLLEEEERRFADVVSDREPPSEPRDEVLPPPPSAPMPATETRRPRSFEEATPRPPRLTPAYRPPERPRRGSSAATMLIVALLAIALAVAGGYYAASRYFGRGTTGQDAATPPAASQGSGGATAPQGQVPTPSLETVPSEPSLPAAEPGAAGQQGASAPAAQPSTAPPSSPSGKTGAGATGGTGAAGKRGSATSKPDSTKSSSRTARPKTPPPPPRATSAPSARRSPSTVFEGGLSIASRPSGARVFLDGHPVGTTPMTLSKVSAGSHVVRLQSDGYAAWSAAVQVTAGETNRVTASLDRQQH